MWNIKQHRKVEKYLEKQRKADKNGIDDVLIFIDEILRHSQNPSNLPNAKKMRGSYENLGNFWRWRVGHYRIIGEIKGKELTINLVELDQRESVY